MKARSFLGLILAVIMSISWNPMQALAAEEVDILQFQRTSQPSAEENVGEAFDADMAAARAALISNLSIELEFNSSGLHVKFYTAANQKAEEIGVEDVKIQKKVGIFWTTVATAAHDGAGDTDTYNSSITYGNVESGKTYRVTCTHFAYIGGNYLQQSNTSAEVKCP